MNGEDLLVKFFVLRDTSPQAGKENLANKIEWVSQTQGDGLGCGILSRSTNGTDGYIEVKSIKLTKVEIPFAFRRCSMISRGETGRASFYIGYLT
jgi:hypothetical protein